MRRSDRFRWGRASCLAIASVLALQVSCTVESTPSIPNAVSLAVQTVLPSQEQAAALAEVDRARVAAVRPPSTVVAETTVTVPPGASTLTVELEVALNSQVEELIIVVELWAGELLALAGELPVVVDASQAVTNAPIIALVPVAPALEVTPLSLDYSVITGAGPEEFPFTVRNTGGLPMNWSATTDVPGLSIVPATGVLTQDQAASVVALQDPGQLAPGAYGGTITVVDPLALNSPQTIQVTVEVTERPIIELSTSTLVFDAHQLADPPPQQLIIGNVGQGVLDWTAATEADWLGLNPPSGAIGAQESFPLTVSPSSVGLPLGSYSATITIQDPNAENSPQVVDVRMVVVEAPSISLSATSLSFAAWLSEDPTAQIVTLTNGGGGTLSWTTSAGATWLIVSPTAGVVGSTESDLLSVSPAVAGLEPGSYSSEVTVESADASNSPQSISVDMVVTERPRIGLSPTSMTFVDVNCGDGDPPNQSLSVSNTGGSALEWRTTDSSIWLATSPTSGTLQPGQSQAVTVSAQGGFSDHTATISVRDVDASNSPRTVSVVMDSPSYCSGLSPSD